MSDFTDDLYDPSNDDFTHPKVWTTKQGKILYFFEMDLNHLKNVKTLLEKQNKHIPYNLLKEIYNKEKL